MIGSASRTLRDGMAAALARDFDAAHQLLQRATTENPTDIRAWLWRALASPTPADAIGCLRRVLVFEPAIFRSFAQTDSVRTRELQPVS